MPLYPDVSLSLTGTKKEDERQFEVTFLHKRLQVLEAIVFELLRDKVNYGTVSGYKDRIEKLGFTPSTSMFGKDGAQLSTKCSRIGRRKIWSDRLKTRSERSR